MANDGPGWKKELEEDLARLDRQYRSYERTPSQEVREEYERGLSSLWHKHAETLDIHCQAEREMLARTHGVSAGRLSEQRPDYSDVPNFQAELVRLTELQAERSKELGRLCQEPLQEYDRRNRFTRDRDDSDDRGR